MSDLTDHDRRLLRKLSIRLEGAETLDSLNSITADWQAERYPQGALYSASRSLQNIASDRIVGALPADQAKALMRAVWEKPGAPQAVPFRGPEWTLAMEKKLCDRVQVVLADPRMSLVLQTFGAEVFRRSSIFHGLDVFLDAEGVRGG